MGLWLKWLGPLQPYTTIFPSCPPAPPLIQSSTGSTASSSQVTGGPPSPSPTESWVQRHCRHPLSPPLMSCHDRRLLHLPWRARIMIPPPLLRTPHPMHRSPNARRNLILLPRPHPLRGHRTMHPNARAAAANASITSMVIKCARCEGN